tara:strand:+ start:1425 stop:2120 length:696 start_codon:yes stop_codon:yes gene_type:complete
MSFKKLKYKLVRNAISKELSSFLYRYLLMKRRVADLCFKTKYFSPYEEDWGFWNDTQVPNTYAIYGDIAMETLLDQMTSIMEKYTGYQLNPTYAYTRIYKHNDILARHTDRYSCEVSSTMNIGGELWPIFLEPSGKRNQKGKKILLTPGDLLIYSGCHLEHWREPFQGKNCAQVFFHYNDAKLSVKKAKKLSLQMCGSQKTQTANTNKYDTRPFLGLPGYFKNYKLTNKKE